MLNKWIWLNMFTVYSLFYKHMQILNATWFTNTCIQSQEIPPVKGSTPGLGCRFCFGPRYDVELFVWVAFQRMFMSPNRTEQQKLMIPEWGPAE